MTNVLVLVHLYVSDIQIDRERELIIGRYGTRGVYLLGTAVLYLSVLAVLLPALVYAETPESGNYQRLIKQAETIPDMIKDKVLAKSQIPNPHWRKDACQACHASNPDGGMSPLKAQTDRTCYFCHREEDHAITHPVNLAPGKKMLAGMSKEFRDNLSKDNKTNCITCHDVLMSCIKPTAVMRLRNKSFVRGGYYNTRSGACYQCHDKAAYKKLNPHDQISDQGVLNKEKCLVCHRGVPQQGVSGSAAKVSMQTDSNWSEICLNCHKWTPHPGGNMAMFSGGKPPNHLVVPDDRIRNRLEAMMQKNNIDMPLEPGSGKIFCATCHNPHERGVIKKVSLAKGADEENRLRSKRLCINCHDK